MKLQGSLGRTALFLSQKSDPLHRRATPALYSVELGFYKGAEPHRAASKLQLAAGPGCKCLAGCTSPPAADAQRAEGHIRRICSPFVGFHGALVVTNDLS
jgi:hypothetical protein